MSFSTQLRKAMLERNMSQSELSALTGIGKSSISQYISGKNEPKDIAIKKISEALECTFESQKSDVCQLEKSDAMPQFSTKKITIRQASKVMHISENTLAEKLRNGEVSFGWANKVSGSSKHSYYISPKLFYEYTGWCY